MQHNQSEQSIIEFPSHFFDDAINLMHEAQHYFDILAYDDTLESDPQIWLQYTTEMSMVTLRLTSIISWIVTHKKLETQSHGKIENFHLKGRIIGSIHNPENLNGLPPHLKHLLESSHALFMQALNLEDQNSALKEVSSGLTLVKS